MDEEHINPYHEKIFPYIVERYKKVITRLYAFRDQLKTEGCKPGLCSEQLSLPGTDFSLQRFTEDVFTYMATLARIPPKYIPPALNQENVYIHGEDTIAYVCRLALYDLMRYFNTIFSYFDLTKIKSKVDCEERVLISMEHWIKGLPRQSLARKFHGSLAFVVCLAIYLAKENFDSPPRDDLPDVFRKLQASWLLYFKINIWKDFERIGLFRILIDFSKNSVHGISTYRDYFEKSFKLDRRMLQYSAFKKYLVDNNKTNLNEIAQPSVDYESSDEDEDDSGQLSYYDRIGFIPHEIYVEEVMKEESKSPSKCSKKLEAFKSKAAGTCRQSPTREELQKKLREKIKYREDIRCGRVTPEEIAINALEECEDTKEGVLTKYVYQVLFQELLTLDEIIRLFLSENQSEKDVIL